MPINFPDILNQLKNGLIDLAKNTLSDYLNGAKTDAQSLLDSLKNDLQTWTAQLANGDITEQDLEYLINAKKDLIEMGALKQAGLTQIRVDQFKAAALSLITSTIISFTRGGPG